MRKSIIATVASSLLLLGAFQNCGKLGFSTDNASSVVSSLGLSSNVLGQSSGLGDDDGPPVTSPAGGENDPSLAVNAHPRHPREGQSTVVTAFPQNLDVLYYSCSPTSDPTTVVASGVINAEQMMFKLVVDRDVICAFTGRNNNVAAPILVPFEIDVQCGARVKNSAGACEDVACRSFAELGADARGLWNDVPARTDDGVCYYKKILNGLPAGPLAENFPRDGNITAGDPAESNGNPTLTTSFAGSFRLRGPRTVRLSSAPDQVAPLTVDNLLLVGTFNADLAPDYSIDYRAFGAPAAGLIKDGQDTGVVNFHNAPLALVRTPADAPTVVPSPDLTSFAEVRRRQALDVRMLTTGATRANSDVYVLFQ